MILRPDEHPVYPDIQSTSRALPLGRLPRERFSPWVGSGHSAKGLSRYVVVNAKVFLDSADAPQEVIDFFPAIHRASPCAF